MPGHLGAIRINEQLARLSNVETVRPITDCIDLSFARQACGLETEISITAATDKHMEPTNTMTRVGWVHSWEADRMWKALGSISTLQTINDH